MGTNSHISDFQMYVDQTPLFRTTLTSVTSRADELGLVIPGKDKSRILGGHNLTKQAQNIVQTVRSLADLLQDHRAAYVQTHGGGTARQMGEAERDQVDAGADNIARQCRNLIVKYRTEVQKEKFNESAEEHYECVALGLEKYLKSVVSIHSEMRAVRVAKQIQQKKLSRLEVNSVESRALEIGGGQGTSATDMLELREKAVAAAASVTTSYSAWGEESEEEMSPEEAAMMEMENERLVDQLNSLNNAVEQVQSKVVKIAELQSIFTEKVMEQAEDIERIHVDTVASTENINMGNQEIRKAIQNKASYRVYILFIILVFSFSLLFLDWYND